MFVILSLALCLFTVIGGIIIGTSEFQRRRCKNLEICISGKKDDARYSIVLRGHDYILRDLAKYKGRSLVNFEMILHDISMNYPRFKLYLTYTSLDKMETDYITTTIDGIKAKDLVKMVNTFYKNYLK